MPSDAKESEASAYTELEKKVLQLEARLSALQAEISAAKLAGESEAPPPAGLPGGYLGLPESGGSDIPPPPGTGGIYMLVARRYGSNSIYQYAWVKPPFSASRLGYIPVLVDTVDMEGDTHLEVEWLDVSTVEKVGHTHED